MRSVDLYAGENGFNLIQLFRSYQFNLFFVVILSITCVYHFIYYSLFLYFPTLYSFILIYSFLFLPLFFYSFFSDTVSRPLFIYNSLFLYLPGLYLFLFFILLLSRFFVLLFYMKGKKVLHFISFTNFTFMFSILNRKIKLN